MYYSYRFTDDYIKINGEKYYQEAYLIFDNFKKFNVWSAKSKCDPLKGHTVYAAAAPKYFIPFISEAALSEKRKSRIDKVVLLRLQNDKWF